MSEVEPTETTLPFMSSPPDLNIQRSFAMAANQSNEESFEHFNFPITLNPITPSSVVIPQPVPEEETEVTAKTIKLKRQTHTRNYKLYAGNTYFFCGGRFLTSKALGAFCLSLLILWGPCILFLIFTCPWLWYHISPAVPIVYAYMFSITFASMLKTSWTDPGILPRNLDGVSPPLNTASQDEFGFRYSNMSDYNMPLPKEVLINENEDHHCIWLNNCVGKRNYTTFFTFVVGGTLSCSYIIAFSLAHVIILCLETTDKSFEKALAKAPVSFVVALICLILLFPICGLTFYHCILIMRGITTHEQIRSGSNPFDHHPFDLGNPFKNMLYVLCRPHNKSYIARRKYAEEVYEIKEQPVLNSKGVVTHSNVSTTVQNESSAQNSNLEPVIASGVPLQQRTNK
ncbi:hypothetical protein INT47_007200 [Mucor saturninus]|uniref:Palmitoyltransferase n=1 Tax=Mucor saturninus TaxID=64648 RepID=A0A8H7V339_9FUNG|nr:hypothetical protein INT47_007200 [Mucor saturninus]